MRTTILMAGLLAGLAGAAALAQQGTAPDADGTILGQAEPSTPDPQQTETRDLRALMNEMHEMMSRMGGMNGPHGMDGAAHMSPRHMDEMLGGGDVDLMGDVPNTAPLALDIYDTDGDGRITPEEIEARKAARFAQADADGDGGLSPEELLALEQAIRQEIQLGQSAERLRRLDDNEDGLLQAEEIEARSPRIAPIFDRLDADGDGGITQEELDGARTERGAHGGVLGRLMGGHGRHGH